MNLKLSSPGDDANFSYTAPKPRVNKQAPEPAPAPASAPSTQAPKVLRGSLFAFDDGQRQYISLGTCGVVIIETAPAVRKLMVYIEPEPGKQQTVFTADVNGQLNTVFTPNEQYRSFSAHGRAFSVFLEAADSAELASIINKASAPDLIAETSGSGTTVVKDGYRVGLVYRVAAVPADWATQPPQGPPQALFEQNDELVFVLGQQDSALGDYEELLLGMRKGGVRLFLCPPGTTVFGAPAGTPFMLSVTLLRTKRAKSDAPAPAVVTPALSDVKPSPHLPPAPAPAPMAAPAPVPAPVAAPTAPAPSSPAPAAPAPTQPEFRLPANIVTTEALAAALAPISAAVTTLQERLAPATVPADVPSADKLVLSLQRLLDTCYHAEDRVTAAEEAAKDAKDELSGLLRNHERELSRMAARYSKNVDELNAKLKKTKRVVMQLKKYKEEAGAAREIVSGLQDELSRARADLADVEESAELEAAALRRELVRRENDLAARDAVIARLTAERDQGVVAPVNVAVPEPEPEQSETEFTVSEPSDDDEEEDDLVTRGSEDDGSEDNVIHYGMPEYDEDEDDSDDDVGDIDFEGGDSTEVPLSEREEFIPEARRATIPDDAGSSGPRSSEADSLEVEGSEQEAEIDESPAEESPVAYDDGKDDEDEEQEQEEEEEADDNEDEDDDGEYEAGTKNYVVSDISDVSDVSLDDLDL
ncbi:hypothetical protein J8273_0187 [Carpediemonas membranifera]|uniref:Uncharacterized protein n=1 Tax=Carpediemonas membranifera TaxID=201153 RepID=A0A8J6B7W4_9EUKA|nr:hypothetical protein J8273_0187 [Carpediemonas membranifera]|eukprot:KAG9394979.1 hypothetical protein J8273_0187 [Carpediemonas membranifera]